MLLKSIGAVSNVFNVVTKDLQDGKNAVIAMQFALKGMEVEQVEAAVSAMKLSAAQTAVTLSATGMEVSQIAATLAAKGFTQEEVKEALVTAGLTPELAAAAVAGVEFAAAQGTAAVATGAFTNAIVAATKGLVAFLLTNPVGWAILAAGAIAGLVAVVDALTVSFDEAIEKAQESQQAYEEQAAKVKSLSSELQTAKERMDELTAKGSLTLMEQEELKKLETTNVLLQKQLEIEQAIERYRNQEARKDANNALTNRDFTVNEDGSDKYVDIIDYTITRQELLNALTERQNKLINQQNELLDESGEITDISKYNQYKRRLEDVDKEITEVMSEIAESWDVISTYQGTLIDGNGQAIAGFEDTVERIAALSDLILDSAQRMISELDNLPEDLKTVLNTEGSKGELTADRISELAGQYQELADWLEKSGYTADEVASHYNALFTAQKNAAESTGVYTASLSDLKEVLSDLQSSYDALEAAETDMAAGGGLTPETIAKLADVEENYLAYLYEENGVVKLNTEAWKENANAKMQSEMAEIQKEIDSIKEQNKLIQDQIALYEEKQRAERNNGSDATADYYLNLIRELNEELDANNAAIEDNQGKLAIYSSLYGSITSILVLWPAGPLCLRLSVQRLAPCLVRSWIRTGLRMSMEMAMELRLPLQRQTGLYAQQKWTKQVRQFDEGGQSVMNTEWVRWIAAICSGLAATIPLVNQLVKYVKKAVQEKNWPEIVRIVTKYMERAETMFETGADRKEWVLAMVKSSSELVEYDLDMDRISALIDSLCEMSKIVNGESKEGVT